ncbi:hypothetical protein [Aestuariirhabdus litorea]|uniref:Uncharacterized protein n=1 Tax=Aestuariirhabdus litorea TaxID=2528527 RepID=A0A3P3VIP0_9GAMM|nr:hypothetical protein [Aestuariirhabdus litorea]RRJ82532.1 hypothetical protein D0544_11720 [Aestuariirhabdus litorea]RWW92693.1 hypothetical protein DZC74_11695 [Endozoicomonadaceae bacterium GTF-13]
MTTLVSGADCQVNTINTQSVASLLGLLLPCFTQAIALIALMTFTAIPVAMFEYGEPASDLDILELSASSAGAVTLCVALQWNGAS